METMKSIALNTPIVRSIIKLRYDRRFENNQGEQLYRGVFSSYDEAAVSSPVPKVGYDHPEPAAMYKAFMTELQSYDYPVLFWLNKVLEGDPENRRGLFDYGGHIGIKYYAYHRFLRNVLEWTVCDVPAVILRGAGMAVDLDPDHLLRFTLSFDEVAGKRTLLCLGSLQYIEESLADKLSRVALGARPRHVLINTTAFVHEGERSFWTLNSIGTSFCPYKVQSEQAFVADMEKVGYARLDTWVNPGRSCHVPFQSSHRDFKYLGMCFGMS